jgi:hypothetical protein
VIGMLRELAERPIAERERRRLFALSAAVVLCAAGLLFALRPGAADDPKPTPPPAATRPGLGPPAPPVADRSDSAPSPTPGGAEDAGRPAHRARPDTRRRRPAGPAGRVPEGVERAARRFLRAYLPFVYGRGPARAIQPATAALRARLARSRVRVPPAARRRYPRVVALRLRAAAAGRFAVSARIEDGGQARYPIELVAARRDGRWRVVEAGGH